MVKPGYKQTEIGEIPEDWEVKPLKAIAPLQRGFDLPYSQIRDGKFPVVFSNGIGAYHNDYMVKGPGVVTGRSGTIGKVHYVHHDYWPHNTSLWVTNFNKNNSKFIYYLFQTISWDLFNSGSGVPTLNRNDIHDTLYSVPPISEQERIAEALSDVDALIASLEKLIAKKKAIKQGAMQRLLTGKTRLPGFEGKLKKTELGEIPEDWEVTPLKQLYNITSSKRVFQSEWKNSGVPFYRAREIAVMSEGKTPSKELLYISEEMYNSYTSQYGAIRENDILITGVGTLGKVYVVQASDKFYFKDGNIIWLQWKGGSCSRFIKYLYDTPLLQHQVQDNSGGSTVGTYTISNAKETLIPNPSLPEQNAIAAVLADLDAELESLSQKLAKTRQLKQGMMQQLLTGKIRLV